MYFEYSLSKLRKTVFHFFPTQSLHILGIFCKISVKITCINYENVSAAEIIFKWENKNENFVISHIGNNAMKNS